METTDKSGQVIFYGSHARLPSPAWDLLLPLGWFDHLVFSSFSRHASSLPLDLQRCIGQTSFLLQCLVLSPSDGVGSLCLARGREMALCVFQVFEVLFVSKRTVELGLRYPSSTIRPHLDSHIDLSVTTGQRIRTYTTARGDLDCGFQ